MRIHADLHIHSSLSPCGDLEMSPASIARQARLMGLDIIAVADHNSIENSFYTAEAAKDAGLHALFGMEAQTEEDIHVLCLFDDRRRAEQFYTEIYPAIPNLENDPDIFGEQVVADADDNIIRFETKLLLNSLEMDLQTLLETTRRFGGATIPCHVESERFGLMRVLGFLPEELRNQPLEISYNTDRNALIQRYPELEKIPLITNSDAHYLRDIGRGFTRLNLASFSVAEIMRAILEGEYEAIQPRKNERP